MFCGPWVDLLQPTLHFQAKGGRPYEFLTITRSATTNVESLHLYYKIGPKYGFLGPKLLLGDLAPNKPPTQKS